MPAPQLITPKPKPAAVPRRTSVSIKVPAELGEELRALKRRVKEHAGEVDFHLDAVVADMLSKLVRQANEQLDQLARDGAGSARNGAPD